MKLKNRGTNTFVTKFALVWIVLLISIPRLSAQDFAWAASFGNIQADNSTAMAVDKYGNLFVTGQYMFTIDCDPGPAIFNLSGTGSSFICKYAANGNLIWAKSIGGSGTVWSRSVKVDSFGNVYTVGQYAGTVDFDPGPGTYYLTTQNLDIDIYVSKLDSFGNFLWAKKMGSSAGDDMFSLAIDKNGNPIYTGNFTSPIDFDPGPGTFILSPGPIAAFISKLDTAGNFLWAKHFNTGGPIKGYSIRTDDSGNIYTCGSFTTTTDFDPGAGVFNLSDTAGGGMFISKLDPSGNFVWAGQVGGAGFDLATSLTVDHSHHLYVTGFFSGTADFNPGAGTDNLISSGLNDRFLLKLNLEGDFLWVKQIADTGSGFVQNQSVTTDFIDNIYLTGNFMGRTDFDPGVGVFNLNALGAIDIFIAKLDSAGNFNWALQMGDTANNIVKTGVEIAVAPSYRIYTTGNFKETVDFDSGPGVYNLTSAGQFDYYIHQLYQCYPSNPISITAAANLLICSGDSTILSASGNGNLVWYADSVGGTILGSGNAFVTPNLNDTTTFYVYDTTQCTLSRTPITVNVIPNSTSTTTISICANQTPYAWNAQSLDSTGTYTAIFTGFNGCDSVATLLLNVSPCIVCVPDFTINYSPFYNSLTESQSWIITSGTVLIVAGTTVKLDANANSYVTLNPGFKADSGSVFIAQAYNGCTAGAPQLPNAKIFNGDPSAAADEIVLYPNPTTGMIHIQHDEKLNSIQIFDMVGKLMITQKCNGETETNIDLSNLPNGVYHVKAAGYHSVKVVKSN